MKLELISHALCPFVHRAAIMLHEKGVAFDRKNIDLKQKPDWFLALSPRGKVPVLLADGVALFESAAICEFLDETHPPALIPAEPFERARQRGWVEIANDLLSAQYKLCTVKSPAELEAAAQATGPILARLEEALASGAVAETGFGLVHVALAPALHRFVVLEELVGARLKEHMGGGFWRGTPKAEALARRLATRPSITQTVPDDFGPQFIQLFTDLGGALFAAAPAA
jgi:glutathione S-transferase